MYCDAIATPVAALFIFIIFFLSLQMNEILQFISLQMNEILKVELQFVSSQCPLDISIIVRNPEVNPIIASCENM